MEVISNRLPKYRMNLLELSEFNAKIVGELYRAFVYGNADMALKFISQDYILHVPGNGVNAGEHWGHDGFRDFMTRIARHNGGIFEMQVPVFSVSGDNIFTREIVRMNRAQDPEKIWTLSISNWIKVRDGKVVESWIIPEDPGLYDEFWAASKSGHNPPKVSGGGSEPHQVLAVEEAFSERNLHLIESLYYSFWAGNMDEIHEAFSHDVVVNIIGRSAISGMYTGWDGFLNFRSKLMATSGGKYKLDVSAFAASANDAWALEYIRMNRAWDPVVREIFVLMHFEIQNGKIVRIDDFPVDLLKWEKFYTVNNV